jgi:hypothetical protein
MPISAEEYKIKYQPTTIIKLQSGVEFELKNNVNSRELICKQIMPLTDDISKTAEEKKIIRWARMSEADKENALKVNNQMLVMAVNSPELSLEKEEGKLWIKDLTDADYYELLGKVIEICYGGAIKLPFLNADTQQG